MITRSDDYLVSVSLGGPTWALRYVVLVVVPATAVGAIKQLGLFAAFKSLISTWRAIAERGAACCAAISPQMISEAGPQRVVGWKMKV